MEGARGVDYPLTPDRQEIRYYARLLCFEGFRVNPVHLHCVGLAGLEVTTQGNLGYYHRQVGGAGHPRVYHLQVRN